MSGNTADSPRLKTSRRGQTFVGYSSDEGPLTAIIQIQAVPHVCRCFEGAVAACAAPLVGLLAEKVFGFRGTATRTGDRALDLAKANAMGNALLCFLIVPWTLCLIAYCGEPLPHTGSPYTHPFF